MYSDDESLRSIEDTIFDGNLHVLRVRNQLD